MAFDGSTLGIDHGEKFIGLALSHGGVFVKPFQVIRRKSKADDFAKINGVILEHRINQIVLGLPPRPPDFVGYSQSDKVRNWAVYLQNAIPDDIPIYLWEEGLTSVDAESQLREVGKKAERVDAHAAALILQQCLDAIRERDAQPELFTGEE